MIIRTNILSVLTTVIYDDSLILMQYHKTSVSWHVWVHRYKFLFYITLHNDFVLICSFVFSYFVFCGSFLLFMFCVCHAFLSVHCILVDTYWERALHLAFLFVMFSCDFVTIPYGVLGQVWYLVVSIPDIRLLTYFV